MKTNIGVIFGGKTVEHEISIITANQVMNALDSERFHVIPLYLTKDNKFLTGDMLLHLENYKSLAEIENKCQRVSLNAHNNQVEVSHYPGKLFRNNRIALVDIFFPVVHGTNVEDGTLQGYLELFPVPYVSSDVKSSAVGQDKIFMKHIFKAEDISCVDYVWFHTNQFTSNPDLCVDSCQHLGYPMIVKPSNLGSSVGISLVKDHDELRTAIELALSFDEKVIVEQAVTDLIEVNCSVFGEFGDIKLSEIEQVEMSENFLTYEDKYQGNNNSKSKLKVSSGPAKGMANTSRQIPANISDEQRTTVYDLSKRVYEVLGLSGVSRIDFLIDGNTDKVYVNEVNTIPGSLAFYLWQPVGIDFSQLCDYLITYSIKRFSQRQKRVYSHKINLLENYDKSSVKKMQK